MTIDIEIEKRIIELYQGDFQMKSIAEQVQLPITSVKWIINKNRDVLPRRLKTNYMRKYTHDESCFDSWNRNNAYVYGLLLTDGNLRDGQRSIQILSKDKEVCENVKRVFSATNIIENVDGYHCVRIRSYDLFDRLVELGLSPRKSGVVGPPSSLPQEFESDFVRGCIDGDGGIYLQNNNNYPVVGFGTQSNKMFEYMRNIMLAHSGYINYRPNVYITPNGFHNLRVCGLMNCKEFIKYMYKEPLDGFYIKRKYEIAMKILEM